MFPTPDEIRAARAENPKHRARDLADKLGISEAQLVASDVGRGATRIAAHPDGLMAAAASLGEVMALTRNESCVSEKVGRYANYTPGQHAAMVLNGAIDLRIFPRHWVNAFAVETEGEAGPRRSLQVFDAAGDAMHKIHLRETSNHGAWSGLVTSLAVADQSDTLAVEPRPEPEGARSDPERLEVLRKEWLRMTDTHQFLRLTSKLKMNRLGAYRIVGEPWVRPLSTASVPEMLNRVSAEGCEAMIFVGNRGCIQIHSGRLDRIVPMGPWQNVMDPGFNLHLRGDHVAEVWQVEKPTQRGPALSVEAFAANGDLIFQAFPVAKPENDHRPAWREIVEALPGLEVPA